MEETLAQLNLAQREAVEHIDGALLILAGAGSGKTKTLTTRLAYLIGVVGIDPANTLTLTFTNKAATEMRDRALRIIPCETPYPPMLSTFHKFGLLFLKFHIDMLGRKNNFTILDTDDKKKILRTLMKNLNIDLEISFVASEISKYKNALISPQEAMNTATLSDYKKVAQIYQYYQTHTHKNNVVDFDDLLMLTYQILDENKTLREETSQRYRYIMVDEYQDTNELQFQLLKHLCSTHNNLCVVGDDDQSIYGWRGANINNILEFGEHFKTTKTIKLETNYRSTQPILNAANTLIAHNTRRLGKTLKSHRGEGEAIKLIHSFDENDEAKTIAQKIRSLLDSGVKANEIAVLYRINALSRSLEEGFTKERIAFKLIGGMRFYERAEIKDAIAYLRVITNTSDNFSFLRIINTPKRGIGKTSVDKLQHASTQQSLSIFDYARTVPSLMLEKILGKKMVKSLQTLIEDITLLQEEIHHQGDFITQFESRFKLKSYYAAMADGADRLLNIDEFYGYFRDFSNKYPTLELEDFLNEITLQSDQDQIEGDAITIMSVHASKGLEFEHLFVIGLEEEFFPLLGDGCNMEEERRLGYVAITRAKSHLTLCYADSRFYRGKRKMIDKSRFLGEAGLLLRNERVQIAEETPFQKGDFVKHPIFGIGRVEGVNRVGKDYKLTINFGGDRRDIISRYVIPLESFL